MYVSRHVVFVANEFPFQTLVRKYLSSHNTPLSTGSPLPIILKNLSLCPLHTTPNATHSPPMSPENSSPAQHMNPSPEHSSSGSLSPPRNSSSHGLPSTVHHLAGDEAATDTTPTAPAPVAPAPESAAVVAEPVSSASVPHTVVAASSSQVSDPV